MIALFISIAKSASAAEINWGRLIVDRKPHSISWVQEKDDWVLTAHFDKAIIRTYFKNPPPPIGLGLDPKNRPERQEFLYFPIGKIFTSTNCQFEQWLDGGKAYAFEYNNEFALHGEKHELAVVSIVEGTTDPSEVRYSLFKTI